MNEFHERLISEERELNVKFNRISNFLALGKDKCITEEGRTLLRLQHHVMHTYIDILQARLKLLE